jgi:phenylacetic acid degradation operon negative regulatory protein
MMRADVAGEPDAVAPLAGNARRESTTKSQALLVALIADYSVGHSAPFASAAIVRVLGEFGVSPAGARSALSRVTRRGILLASKVGRQTYYMVNPQDFDARLDRLRHYVDFGAAHPRWDGTWTAVMFTVSEDERSQRSRLRSALERLGFAPMLDGVWVRPGDHRDAAAAMARDLDVRIATTCAAIGDGGIAPLDAFDLDSTRGLYARFLEEFEPILDRLDAGMLGAAEALVARTRVLDAWRTIALEDPDLPLELLPADWPLPRARRVFVELWERSRHLGYLRFHDIVREVDPEFPIEEKA